MYREVGKNQLEFTEMFSFTIKRETKYISTHTQITDGF